MILEIAPFFSSKLSPEQLNNLMHIRLVVDWLSKQSANFATLFTDHSINHSEAIIQMVELFTQNNEIELNSNEIYILIAAAYLHDIGFAIGEYRPDLLNGDSLKINIIRRKHHLYSSDFILNKELQVSLGSNLGIPQNLETFVATLCQAHNSPSTVSDLSELIENNELHVRLRLIAILLRIGDELHVGRSRVILSNLSKDIGTLKKRLFWYGYSCIETIRILKGEIQLNFGYSEKINIIDFIEQISSKIVNYYIAQFDWINTILQSYNYSPILVKFQVAISSLPDTDTTSILLSLVTTELALRQRNEERKKLIEEKINKKGLISKKAIDDELIILRRWSSYTPRMPFWNNSPASISKNTNGAKGGGYFLIWNQSGIVIDPGYDFLHNLWNLEIPTENYFELDDINAVIASHAHDDHTHDIEPLISLLNKRIKITGNKTVIPFFVSEGTHIKYERLFSINDFVKVTDLISNGSINKIDDLFLNNQGIKIKILRTNHNELPWLRHHSGVAVKLYLSGKNGDITIGYTSDTQFFEGLVSFFKDVDILLFHFGNVGPSLPNYDKNHLGLNGCHDLITKLISDKPILFLLDEFGEEEVGEDRLKLCALLSNLTNLKKNGSVLLPMDIGLRIKLPTRDVFCQEHQQFEPFSSIVPHLIPNDDCIKYFCL